MIRIFNQYVSPKSLLLMAVESVLIALALLFAVRLRFWDSQAAFQVYTAFPDFIVQTLVIIIIFQVCFYFNDLYDFNANRRRNEQMIRVGQSLGAACLLLGLVYSLIPSLLIARGVFFISMVLGSTFIVGSRFVVDFAWKVAPPQNVIILGTRELALIVARELGNRGDLHLKLAGFVGDSQPNNGNTSPDLFGNPVLGTAEELEALVEEHHVSRIVVALEDRRGSLPTAALVRLRVQGVWIEDAHSTMAGLTGRVWLDAVRPSWFVFSDGFRRSRLNTVVKRAIDLGLGLAGFIVSAPIMLLTALAVRLDSKGPILYRQVRVGWKGKFFEVLKFRSMRVDAEAQNGAQWASEVDPRATRVGRIIRKYRLDELPQFINVIRGDMSFVGPRPERPMFVNELRKLIPYYDERHSVRPGITGWAQVQYRYGASVEDSARKLEYDLFYLKNMSLLFDCAIVLQTIRTVLSGSSAR